MNQLNKSSLIKNKGKTPHQEVNVNTDYIFENDIPHFDNYF